MTSTSHPLWRFLAGLCGCLLAPLALAAAPIELIAPDAVRPLLAAHLTTLREDALPDVADERERQALIRRTRTEVESLLATEGYFTPTVRRVGDTKMPMRVEVIPGARAEIAEVDIRFAGQLTDARYAERREALRQAWALPVGAPFRQADWDSAKGQLLDAVAYRDFAAARLTQTRAEVDPEAARVRLSVSIDSGPPFTLGPLEIEGLQDYPDDLVARYNLIEPGDAYDQDRLLEFQSVLQSTPYFSSVIVDVPTRGIDPERVPIQVRVVEARPKRVGLGIGFSSNNGYRTEASYRDANLFGRGWLLTTGVRLQQRDQLAYADIFLPPERGGRQDSLGAQIERSDTQGLRITSSAIGVARRHQRGDIETHLALKLQREIYAPEDAEEDHRQALSLNWTWTWRQVDNLLDPREGFVVSGQIGGGAKAALSDQNFLRLAGRVVRYQPVGERDVIILRADGGVTLAPSRDGIPQDFLFRTGGAQSVRGYAYQSLGVAEGSATVGGRYMAAVSAEYVHWLKNDWGIAAFVDAGNAADERATFRLKPGYGLGARWRSPAGPLAVDLAYGHDDRTLRLHFAIAVAF
ncbi:autotransporter assembly complex protein TamA [Denitromonas iodatirespirans]|uniref:Outer membrane protein assembly factor n=1 Tax=Denitromonas iodatirespirans TaxID=2795389 RepID=A0A944H6Y2_DENI1|nr:autotransporter assembly complex family protein [Denitromonas iodatirespirans]MBT0960624.1 outer membrane protein assembly factor [Denitromonas iodatirespirans]